MFASKSDHLSSKFLNGLSEQAKGRSAWFFAFWALMLYQVFVIGSLSESIEKGERILVPYALHTADKNITYSSDFTEGTDYIKLIAEADVILQKNSRPDNIAAKTNKFLRRLHPELFRQAKESLLNEATSNALREVTTSFRVLESFADDDGRIRVDGLLKVDVAGIQGPSAKTTVIVTYKKGASGYPFISGWEIVPTAQVTK